MESLLGRNKTRHYDLVIGATLPTAGWRLLVAVSGITDQLPKKHLPNLLHCLRAFLIVFGEPAASLCDVLLYSRLSEVRIPRKGEDITGIKKNL